MGRRFRAETLIFSFGLLISASALYAEPTGHPVRMIRDAINERNLVVLEGNTRPEATAKNDRGIVPDSFALSHLILQLKQSPEREAAMKDYIDQLHDRQSPNFHHWLTAAQFAEHYGIAKDDVDVVSGWLKQQGFKIDSVRPSGLAIEFTGTAGLVRSAFHTEIHNLDVNGEKHFANMSDPSIPAALLPVTAGVVALHNFFPKPMLVPRKSYTYTGPYGPEYAIVPGDLATIYNFTPAYTAGYTGKGQTIMVVEDTYVYSVNDWATFRSALGLTALYPDATLTQISPQGPFTCANPGFVGKPGQPGYGDDGEAALDVEWSSAAAPNASIVLAACSDTQTAFGGLLALDNVLDGPTADLPSVVSISYGESETYNGAAGNFFFEAAYAQGASEGVSIFVAAGDWGAGVSDANSPPVTHGINVSGFASTPYNVAVGGTDFSWLPDNVPAATYWSSTNNSDYSSALSYIQEMPWNDSCASGVLAAYYGYNPLAFCNSSIGANFIDAISGSGGPSGCATGKPSVAGVVGGTCAGYPKPSWQTGLAGVPSDGVRDVPDVALFASNGFWNSYYVACWTNPDPNVGGGFSCTLPPSNWSGWGGTSISSPIMAGIQALIDEKTGDRWGNPNVVLYGLAKLEYASTGQINYCNSTTVPKIGNICIFYDITQGDNDIVCGATTTGTYLNCVHQSGDTYGLLSTTNNADNPAYLAHSGWDFTSGIGSVNVWQLLQDWPSSH